VVPRRAERARALAKSEVAKRVLFLVDRRSLAAQAVRAFATFAPEASLKLDKIYEVYSQKFRRDDLDDEDDAKFDPKQIPAKYLLEPDPAKPFVYVCTIQRMAITLFGKAAVFTDEEGAADEDDADLLPIPIHAFDLIIADECHRGYTSAEVSTWRNTLDHFDAIKIGLTATPVEHTRDLDLRRQRSPQGLARAAARHPLPRRLRSRRRLRAEDHRGPRRRSPPPADQGVPQPREAF